MALPWISAAWQTQLKTIFPSADRFYIDFRGYDYPAVYDALTYTPLTSGTQWCGYSNATGGYAQYLVDMPTKFVVDIRAKAGFAFDVATNQDLFAWYSNGNNWFSVSYNAAGDAIVANWYQAGIQSYLNSAVLNAATLAAINRITVVVDSTTGTTSGSALYLNGVPVDTSWSANITARGVRCRAVTLRAWGIIGSGLTAGLWNINSVRLFPGVTATAAQVLANFSTVYTEEIVWYLNSCSLGHSRVNVTRYVTSRMCDRLVSDPDTGSLKANRLSLDLKSVSGEFADDQYGAWDPASAVYNGLTTQRYMRRRCRVLAETWYGDDFEPYFIGRLESGFDRSTDPADVSRVSITAVDATAELATRRVRRGRYYEDKWLTSATEADSLLHLFVRLGTQREVYNYLANSSFENATIANSWTASGGTLARVADPLIGSNCGQLANASGIEQTVTQIVTFTGTKKLNLGETYTFPVWLKSAGAAANDITLQERDSGGTNGTSTTAYSLAGGEGWVRFDVTRTLTDATSDRLAVVVEVANGVTLNMECAGLYQMARAPEWFVLNDNDGSGGTESADDADYSTYDTHGFAVDVVTIQHGWARLEPGDAPWDHVKQLAEACLAYKCGFSDANVFTFRAILGDAFTDPLSAATLTAPMDLVTVLQAARANRIIARGVYISKETAGRLVWIASQCGAFVTQADGRISESVGAGATWPPPATYGTFVAKYDLAPGLMTADIKATGSGFKSKGTLPGNIAIGTPREKKLSDGQEIIGVKSARIIQYTDGGKANNLTVTTLDTTTYADGAEILLTNATGSARVICDVGIHGQLVMRSSGRLGFVHDSFVDWDRIEAEGEQVLEVGNDYVVTKVQTEKIADWLWKYNRAIKHQYRLSQAGAWLHLEPGDTVTLTVGGAGQEENINSTCRVVSVQSEGGAGDLGRSSIVLDEIMEGWTFNSTALARAIFSQDYARAFQGTECIVAASGYVGRADYFCDGTDDQTELNAAIVAVNARTGGGAVRCVGEKFYITAAVEMKSGVVLVLGGCTIKKNANDYAIKAVGTSGTHLANVGIVGPGTITRDAADENAMALVRVQYVDDCSIDQLTLVNPCYAAISIDNCPGIGVNHVVATGDLVAPGVSYGMIVGYSPNSNVTDNHIYSLHAMGAAAGIYLLNSNDVLVTNNTIEDIAGNIDGLGNGALGIAIQGGVSASDVSARGNRIRDVYSLGLIPGEGAVAVRSGATAAVVANNRCFNNGQLIDRGNCESTDPPAMTPEVATIKTSCTFARSTDFAHYGTYSYKMSKTGAPGTAARVDLADSTAANDLHGVTVGLSHTNMGYVMIPSVNGPLASEVSIVLQDSTGGAWSSTGIFATTDYYDAWQAVEVTRTIGTTCAAGGFLPSLAIAAAASSSEYIWWDDLRLRPDGVHNEYGQNFSDTGTGTRESGNSWNAPFQS